jgi:hypothetical protein
VRDLFVLVICLVVLAAMGIPVAAAISDRRARRRGHVLVQVKLADLDLWDSLRIEARGRHHSALDHFERMKRFYDGKEAKDPADVQIWGREVSVGDRLEYLKADARKLELLADRLNEIVSKLRTASGRV